MATVLLIDDFPDALEVWEIFLRASGFDVLVAHDGLEGLDRAERERPDIIVMDLQMPGLSGTELARRLRASEDTRAIPLIASTGRARMTVEDARHAGFDSLLVKPCDPERVVAEIRRLLPTPSTAEE